MPAPPPHDWFRPRLKTLVAEAARAGYALDVAVAVITDIINEAPFNVAPLETDEGWNQDIGQPPDLSADLTGAGGVPSGDSLRGRIDAPDLAFRRGDR
jgi:hypothetical protein